MMLPMKKVLLWSGSPGVVTSASTHDKNGACIASTSVVVESGHQHRMDGQSLPPKICTPCYQR